MKKVAYVCGSRDVVLGATGVSFGGASSNDVTGLF